MADDPLAAAPPAYKHGDMVEAPDGSRWVMHEGLGWTKDIGIPFDKMALPPAAPPGTGPEEAQLAARRRPGP